MPLFTSRDSKQDFTQLSIFTHRPFVIQDMSSSIVMFTRDPDDSFTVYNLKDSLHFRALLYEICH